MRDMINGDTAYDMIMSAFNIGSLAEVEAAAAAIRDQFNLDNKLFSSIYDEKSSLRDELKKCEIIRDYLEARLVATGKEKL